MKYKLMPYVYAQAKECTEKGLPMVRALFVEFPDDPGAWTVEDAYLFGSDIYVAPLMENAKSRPVYLPSGKWIDYQTGKAYNRGWNEIETGEIPCVILVRDGAVIPHAKLAQSTDKIDWSNIELRVYGNSDVAKGVICLPSENKLVSLVLNKKGNSYIVEKGQIEGVKYQIK
jgi:alpha-D-xyloside xylohydrolase